MIDTKTFDYKTFAKLFHALPEINDFYVDAVEAFKTGIIFVDNIGVLHNIPRSYESLVIDEFGLNNTDWSKTFHKSWEKVANAPIEQLAFEQMIHYFSTYGLESLGLNANPVIPVEKVLVDFDAFPNFKAFTIIHRVSESEALEMIKEYLRKTVAPHKDLVNGIINLMQFTDISVDEIQSFELKVARCDQLGIVPENPVDFLRYVIYNLTGKTILVKDKETINAIKYHGAIGRVNVFRDYFSKANITALASIFYRYKPIFLAFKQFPNMSSYINRLRRMAPSYHKPIDDVNVQNFSKLVKEGRIQAAQNVLDKCSGRQLIKLLNFFMSPSNNVYNIRNGKLYVKETTDKDGNETIESMIAKAFKTAELMVVRAWMKHYKNKLFGKIFYLPPYIDYAAPISEKQFIGNIPYGSSVDGSKDKAITAAIHWNNYKGRCTDIDLHMVSDKGQHFGWNGYYRDSNADTVLYSGDMTDATNGAVEAFRFTPSEDETFMLSVNNYTVYNDTPFEFFMTEVDFEDMSMVDVSNALFPAIPLKFSNANSNTIGFFDNNHFFFYGGELGCDLVPKRELYADALKATKNRVENMIGIDTIILCAGGQIVHSLDNLTEEEIADVIDLSPNALTARSLLDIVDI